MQPITIRYDRDAYFVINHEVRDELLRAVDKSIRDIEKHIDENTSIGSCHVLQTSLLYFSEWNSSIYEYIPKIMDAYHKFSFSNIQTYGFLDTSDIWPYLTAREKMLIRLKKMKAFRYFVGYKWDCLDDFIKNNSTVEVDI